MFWYFLELCLEGESPLTIFLSFAPETNISLISKLKKKQFRSQQCCCSSTYVLLCLWSQGGYIELIFHYYQFGQILTNWWHHVTKLKYNSRKSPVYLLKCSHISNPLNYTSVFLLHFQRSVSKEPINLPDSTFCVARHPAHWVWCVQDITHAPYLGIPLTHADINFTQTG